LSTHTSDGASGGTSFVSMVERGARRGIFTVEGKCVGE
jgi:hypothetical protein